MTWRIIFDTLCWICAVIIGDWEEPNFRWSIRRWSERIHFDDDEFIPQLEAQLTLIHSIDNPFLPHRRYLGDFPEKHHHNIIFNSHATTPRTELSRSNSYQSGEAVKRYRIFGTQARTFQQGFQFPLISSLCGIFHLFELSMKFHAILFRSPLYIKGKSVNKTDICVNSFTKVILQIAFLFCHKHSPRNELGK